MVKSRAKKRRERPNAIFGTKQGSSDVRVGLRRGEFFVFRVHPSVEEKALKDHIASKDARVVEMECLTQDSNAPGLCYRILVEGPNPYVLMDPAFWGYGIGCRRFYRKRENGHAKTD